MYTCDAKKHCLLGQTQFLTKIFLPMPLKILPRQRARRRMKEPKLAVWTCCMYVTVISFLFFLRTSPLFPQLVASGDWVGSLIIIKLLASYLCLLRYFQRLQLRWERDMNQVLRPGDNLSLLRCWKINSNCEGLRLN